MRLRPTQIFGHEDGIEVRRQLRPCAVDARHLGAVRAGDDGPRHTVPTQLVEKRFHAGEVVVVHTGFKIDEPTADFGLRLRLSVEIRLKDLHERAPFDALRKVREGGVIAQPDLLPVDGVLPFGVEDHAVQIEERGQRLVRCHKSNEGFRL